MADLGTLQLLPDTTARIFRLPPRRPEVGGLTQAGDVGLPTRGCYDALGGTTRNVVVNLGSCWTNCMRRAVNRIVLKI